MAQSKRFKLNKQDLTKVLTGASIAGAGAVITYLLEVVPSIDFKEYTPIVVAIFSILANAVRKWLAGK